MVSRLLALTNCDTGCDINLPQVTAYSSKVTSLIQLVLCIIAILAVVYIVLAGIKLIISQGDPQAIAKARQAIIYAAIGLVVAMSAEIIVTFVIGRL